jgi:hypothetical protein
LKWQQVAFCKHFQVMGNNQQEQETVLIETTLQGHPGQAAGMETLKIFWAGSMEDDKEVPDEIQACTAAALQEMDREEQEEFSEENKTYCTAGCKAARLAKELLQARRENIEQATPQEETGHEPATAMAPPEATTPPPVKTQHPLQLQHEADTDPTAPTSQAEALRSLVVWARPFVPGGFAATLCQKR